MNNEERIKCCNLMREYGLKCSEFLHGHVWHMPDMEKTQWFAFADPEDLDYIRIATTVQIRTPCQLSKNEYEKSWHIETANTRHEFCRDSWTVQEHSHVNLTAAEWTVCHT